MNAEKKQRQNDYSALTRKLFLRILIAAACAVIAIFVFRRITYGQLAERIINSLSGFFRIDSDAASKIYQFGIRNYFEVFVAIVIIALLLIGFRLLLNAFAKYLDEIMEGIDQLAGQPGTEIKLSPELGFAENRLRSVQQTLERRAQQSKQSEQRKNDLVIYSAHDIRTPLTSALGYLILLDGNPDLASEERKKYTGIALAKTRELDGMLDELFEITRYNLHDISLEEAPIDLYSMLLQMKEELYPQLHTGNKQLLLDMDENTCVNGDAEKLARAFHNLLKNAIAYSAAGSAIGITAQSAGSMVTICFQNKCRPVPQEKLDRLFDQGFRLEERRPDNSAGAGFGLAIAKEIILLHGGTIRAENVDDGICFIVSLPVQSIKKS